MNYFLFIIMFAGFLLLPVVLLAWRSLRPRTMPLWLVLALAAVIGWLLINATVYFYFEFLNDLVSASAPSPSEELVERLTNDGATRVFALLFGWLYSLVFFTVCSLVFGVIRSACRYFTPIPRT